MGIVIVGLIALAFLEAGNARNPREIVKANYGVSLHRLGSITNSHSTWVHSFQIPVMDLQYKPMEEPVCDQANLIIRKHCVTWSYLVRDMNSQRTKMVKEINKHIEIVKNLIPVKVGASRRKRSAPFSFIGDISSSLFGTAKQSDAEEMAKHINAL